MADLVKLTDNVDGWINGFTGAGNSNYDKRTQTTMSLDSILGRTQLSELYRGDGVAKRIVDIPVQDMLRNGFTVDGDPNNAIIKALNKLDFRKAFKMATKLARLFGGSVMVLGIKDRSKGNRGEVGFEKELDEDLIDELSFFRVYDRHHVSWDTSDIDDNVKSPNYGKPKYYTITPVLENSTLEYKVHYSRIIRFTGVELPEMESSEVQWFGDSVLQAPYERIRGLANTLASTESIIEDFIISVMTINNLQDLVATPEGRSALTSRLNQIDKSKHIMNTMLVDKEEDLRRLGIQVNGIKDILEFFKDVTSAVSGIPQIKLFGEQSKGLGSQAAGNIRMYYDDIADYQEDELRPQLERVISLLLKSKAFKEDVPDTWHLRFNPLWAMSDTELAEARKNQADADEIYMKYGALSAAEVANSRFGGETYSFDTVLMPEDDEYREKAKELPFKDNSTGGNVNENAGADQSTD